MKKCRIIDTNLVVRHLVQDHEHHARTASSLFAACDRGAVTLVLLPEVLAETVFVLESYYQHPRAAIGQTLAALVSSPGVEMENRAIHLDALARYQGSKLHYVDCVIAAKAAARRLPVATFDAEFKCFADVIVDLE